MRIDAGAVRAAEAHFTFAPGIRDGVHGRPRLGGVPWSSFHLQGGVSRQTTKGTLRFVLSRLWSARFTERWPTAALVLVCVKVVSRARLAPDVGEQAVAAAGEGHRVRRRIDDDVGRKREVTVAAAGGIHVELDDRLTHRARLRRPTRCTPPPEVIAADELVGDERNAIAAIIGFRATRVSDRVSDGASAGQT